MYLLRITSTYRLIGLSEARKDPWSEGQPSLGKKMLKDGRYLTVLCIRDLHRACFPAHIQHVLDQHITSQISLTTRT